MKRTLLAATALCAACASVQEQTSLRGSQGPAVSYEVAFPNAAHHEARISVTYRGVARGPLELRMSRSSPGRYAIHEFAKNVYDVSAVDGQGRPLEVSQDDPYSWEVRGHDGTVTATYTLYADRAGGTYSGVDLTHAHLNMPATFMWARGYDDRPIEITFAPADPSWKVATQLEPTDDPYTFKAPNFQYFMDSPTELSDFTLREWTIDDDGVERTIRIALHHNGTEEDADRYAAMAEAVVDAQIAVWGDAPDFDYGTYTFIADYLPHISGDGMEHRNSTIIASTVSLQDGDFAQLGTLSHEFFHAWNVERIRPAELEPFDFTAANPTPSLWFAEGFTNYYGPLTIRRAGEYTTAEYAGAMSGSINYVLNGPGRRFRGPAEMSLQAPFVDAATAIDPTNFSNTFVSYYPYGAVVGMALDMILRRDHAITLDDYMRELWRAHGVPERPYTIADLEAGLAAVTGDPAFAADYFDRYVRGSDLPDLAPLLAQGGLLLRRADETSAWAGAVQLDADDSGAVTISGNTLAGSPIYDAGLDRGDEIVSLGGRAIDSADDRSAAVSTYAIGDSAEIRFVSRGMERAADITFAANPSVELVTFEDAGMELTSEQRAFRDAWLGAEPAGD